MTKRRKDPHHSLVNTAVEWRAELVEKGRTATHQLFLENFVRSVNLEGDNLWPRTWTGADVGSYMLGAAEEAALFAVTDDVWQVIMTAAETMPVEGLLPSDLPSRAGWIQLEPGSWLSGDIRGKDNEITAVAWRQEIFQSGREGIRVWFFTDDLRDPPDPRMPATMRAELPRASLYHSSEMSFGQVMYQMPAGVGRASASELYSYLLSHNIEPDEETMTLDVTLSDGTEYHIRPSQHMLYLKSLFAFMRTELLVESRGWPSRKTTKSLPLPFRDKDVTVIELRHIRYTGGATGAGHSWKHRRLVRNHWRRQWYGSGEHRYQRWIPIQAYVAGPEGAPFSKSTIVNRVSR